jgi:hypothetical protein
LTLTDKRSLLKENKNLVVNINKENENIVFNGNNENENKENDCV